MTVVEATGGAFHRLTIREMGSGDLLEVGRHFLNLNAVDRRARFGSAFGEAAVNIYVWGIDLARAVLMGAFEDGRVVGLAEAQPTEVPSRVEIAASVHAPHRRLGLATHLIHLAMSNAFDRGADVAEFTFAPSNKAVIGVIRGLGGTFRGLSGAEIRPIRQGG